jgi:hypothetical protein
MATMHAPGTGFGTGDAGSRRRATAIAAAVVAAAAAIGVPFALGSLDHDHARLAVSRPSGPSRSAGAAQGHAASDTVTTLGPQGDLPPLLAGGAPALRQGARVLVGDVTTGTLAHVRGSGWEVLVRWDDRPQALTMRGPVSLRDPSWVSSAGLLYTRVPTGTPGRFHVYAWSPQGGSVYTPPMMVADDLGTVCFDRAFTAFGNCHVPG